MLSGAGGDCDYLGGNAGLFQAHSLFNGMLIKGIDAHFGGRCIHVRTVCIRANADVVVDNTFDAYKNFHFSEPLNLLNALLLLSRSSGSFADVICVTTKRMRPME